MVIEDPNIINLLLSDLIIFVKILFIVIFLLYFAFALIVVRQVQLMTETVYTEAGPILRALSILHAGLSLGVIVLYIGLA